MPCDGSSHATSPRHKTSRADMLGLSAGILGLLQGPRAARPWPAQGSSGGRGRRLPDQHKVCRRQVYARVSTQAYFCPGSILGRLAQVSNSRLSDWVDKPPRRNVGVTNEQVRGMKLCLICPCRVCSPIRGKERSSCHNLVPQLKANGTVSSDWVQERCG